MYFFPQSNFKKSHIFEFWLDRQGTNDAKNVFPEFFLWSFDICECEVFFSD